MSEHLGYDKHAVDGRGSGNSRNGTRPKTMLTDNVGPVPIEVRGTGSARSSRSPPRRLADPDDSITTADVPSGTMASRTDIEGASAVGVFTDTERDYLRQRRLARVATVGADGTPHVTPVGMWALRADADLIQVRGRDFTATKKYRDVAATGRAAIVIDDLASTDPWGRGASRSAVTPRW